MKKIQLPNYPQSLPSHIDVRDFDLEDGRYVRVFMELDTEVKVGHFHLSAQAYEMTADGNFVTAPNGYPSRTERTTHTVIASALGDTAQLDDDWVRHDGQVSPETVIELQHVDQRPTEPASEYGVLVWDTTHNHAWRWAEGFADGTARAKVQDMLAILASSTVRSGLGFRRN